MKFAAITSASASPVLPRPEQMNLAEAFQACRALLPSQPESVAQKLGRLLDRAEKSIRRQSAARFVQARRLEESIAYIGELRPDHQESQQLQRAVARLLHDAFGAPSWRASVIDGLAASS
ncbi:MAG: hypothetical protein P4M15_08035 [Alphaproteobacteria bacterium]|nr:hypothetical protein [Alphaproteobacteria bacterium]